MGIQGNPNHNEERGPLKAEGLFMKDKSVKTKAASTW